MTVYYKLVCPSRRECIEPGGIGDDTNTDGGGIKFGPFCINHTMQIAACWAIRGKWAGEPMLIVSDTGLRTDMYDAEFEDVTAEAIDFFMECFPKYADDWGLRHVHPESGE